MTARCFLAMDFGGGSGRGMLGRFDGERLILEELHRFPNYFVDVAGLYYWDILRMYHHTLATLEMARERTGNSLSSLGIDTWGTDYGLLDQNGQLLGNCRCMRNADEAVSNQVAKRISFAQLFAKTGIQMIYGNTVFQLFECKLQNDPALAGADTMLMLPDLLAYFLTGQRYSEYTMATTTMLYNPLLGGWDQSILNALGLPKEIFAPIILLAAVSFDLRSSLLADTALTGETKYVPVGTHDTASAVAAAPLEKDMAFCSSGTWSLFGMESDRPVLTDKAYAMNFSNEGTVDGKIRLLKNIMGMWILQQCREQWQKSGQALEWDDLVELARTAPAHQCYIDLEDPQFYSVGDMVKKVQGYCRGTNQAIPESAGEIARCVYESIAFRYRLTVEQLQAVTGKTIRALRIVGGGAINKLLNQFAANAMGIPVLAGPIESACAGNILVQAMACGELAGFAEIRQVVQRSFPTEEYEPRDCPAWSAAYEAYCDIVRPRRG